MKKNMGSVDKSIRFILGIIVVVIGLYYQTWWGLLAVPLFLTSFISFCPGYLPFGFSTCKTKEQE